jgi:hypothetical protein
MLYAFNHGYGYVPFTIASIVFNDGTQAVVGLGSAGVGSTLKIKAYCTSSQFIVSI